MNLILLFSGNQLKKIIYTVLIFARRRYICLKLEAETCSEETKNRQFELPVVFVIHG